MHGYFLFLKLYDAARVIVVYAQHREKKMVKERWRKWLREEYEPKRMLESKLIGRLLRRLQGGRQGEEKGGKEERQEGAKPY